MTKPNIRVMIDRYLVNRSLEKQFREIAERYEKEIIKAVNAEICEKHAKEDLE